MNGAIRVRPAGVDDAAELARLNTEFNGVDDQPQAIAARLADPRRVETPLLAEIDGQVVGFAALRVTPCVFYAQPHAELTELFVRPAYRRRGVGRALLACAEEMARQSGAGELMLLTGLDNTEAQAFYRAQGFTDDDLGMLKQWGDGQ